MSKHFKEYVDKDPGIVYFETMNRYFKDRPDEWKEWEKIMIEVNKEYLEVKRAKG